MEKCSKCLTEESFVMKYTDLHEHWSLCRICNRAFDCQSVLMREFLKEDFGCFPVGQVTKNIINARKKRAMKQSPWDKNET